MNRSSQGPAMLSPHPEGWPSWGGGNKFHPSCHPRLAPEGTPHPPFTTLPGESIPAAGSSFPKTREQSCCFSPDPPPGVKIFGNSEQIAHPPRTAPRGPGANRRDGALPRCTHDRALPAAPAFRLGTPSCQSFPRFPILLHPPVCIPWVLRRKRDLGAALANLGGGEGGSPPWHRRREGTVVSPARTAAGGDTQGRIFPEGNVPELLSAPQMQLQQEQFAAQSALGPRVSVRSKQSSPQPSVQTELHRFPFFFFN